MGLLNLRQGGLSWVGNLTVTGLTTWNAPVTNGTAQNFSVTGTNLFANGGFALGIQLWGDTLTLNTSLAIGAASSWSNNTNGTSTFTGAGSITNNNTITAINPGNISIQVPFTNNATLTKSSGGGNITFTNSFNNTVTTGVLNSNSTAINLQGGGTNDGSFNIATTINIDSGSTYNLSSTSTTSGAGVLSIINSSTLSTTGVVTISSQLNLTLGSLTLGGNLTMTGLTLWNAPSTSGTVENFSITGVGSLLANGGFDLGIRLWGDTLTLDVPLVINGVSSWSNNTNGTTTFSGGSTISNNSTITAINPGNISVQIPFFNNATLTKSSGGGNITFTSVFNNAVTTGILNSNSTAINLQGGGNNDGTFNIATNINIDSGSTFNLTPTSTTTGAGSINIINGSTLNTTGLVTIASQLNLVLGSLTQGNDLTVSGLTLWSPPSTSGTAQNFSITGSGSFFANGGFNLGAPLWADTLTLAVPLVIGAASTWTNNTNGTATISGGGNIVNNSTITANNPGVIDIALAFTNNATLTKAAGNGSLTLSSTFTNSITTGVVNANIATIDLTGGGTNDGVFNIAAIININSGSTYTQSSTGTTAGAGWLQIINGST